MNDLLCTTKIGNINDPKGPVSCSCMQQQCRLSKNLLSPWVFSYCTCSFAVSKYLLTDDFCMNRSVTLFIEEYTWSGYMAFNVPIV